MCHKAWHDFECDANKSYNVAGIGHAWFAFIGSVKTAIVYLM